MTIMINIGMKMISIENDFFISFDAIEFSEFGVTYIWNDDNISMMITNIENYILIDDTHNELSINQLKDLLNKKSLLR